MRSPGRTPAYEYRHVVGFGETNLVGNVYYATHVGWQGRCRELFLRERAPGILALMEDNLALVTTHVECTYFGQLKAFDEVVVRMSLTSLHGSRISMSFDYLRTGADGPALVAKGSQEVACLERTPDGFRPVAVPAELENALNAYSS